MDFYKPTSIADKIRKIFQLYLLFLRAASRPKKSIGTVQPDHLSILMAVPQLDRLGGYETQALQLSETLAASGDLVRIVTDHSEDDLPSREIRAGFVIRRFGSTRTIAAKCYGAIRLLFYLFHNSNSLDVVHAHGVSGLSLFVIRIARFFQVPVVLKPATRGDISSIFTGSGWKMKMYRQWLSRVNRFVAVSEELKQELLNAGVDESRIVKIPNFVNTEKFVPATSQKKELLRSERGVNHDQTVFLFLGRLVERKGLSFLLEAWRQISSGTLWIVGSGQEGQRWIQMSADFQLTNVRFFGATTTPLDFYQAADVFVLPSLSEGSPNVLLEAMSCGLPCIATSIGGVVDIITNGKNGLLVATGSADALVLAMRDIMPCEEKRVILGSEAARYVRAYHDMRKVADLYRSLYAELIGRYKNERVMV